MSLPKITAGRRRWSILALIGLGLLRTAGTVLMARQLSHLIGLSSDSPWSAWPMVSLVLLAVGFYGLKVVEAGLAEEFGQDYVRRVRLRLVRKLFLNSDSADSQRLGAMMSRLVNDLNALKNWVSQGIARGLSALATLVGIFLVSGFYDVYLMGCVMGVAVLSLGFTAVMSRFLRERIRRSRLWRGRMSNHLGEMLSQRETLKAFGRERVELKRVRRRSREIQASQTWRAVSSTMIRRISDCWQGILLVLVILHVSFFSGSSSFSASHMGGVLLWVGLFLSCLSDLNASLDHRLAYLEGARRIEQLMKAGTKKRTVHSGLKEVVREETDLVLDQLRLGTEAPDWSARVSPGERVFLAGESGSGKTRLLQTIAGLREAVGGEVRWRGHSISKATSRHRRAWVQYVGPEIELMRGTVRSNLVWGNRKMDESKLESWAHSHGLVSDLDVFPEGLDTRIHENGKGLPSLARARICLARAVMLQPSILLLDDPHLWMKSEGRDWVLGLLKEWKVTVIWVIGDALPQGIWADQVWRIEGGSLWVDRSPLPPFQKNSHPLELALV